MPDTTVGNRRRDKQQIPRIASKEAEGIFAHCEHLLDNPDALCRNLSQAGFSRFLAQFDEKILELAVQPDSWGERTRARLISAVFTGFRESPAEDASVGGNHGHLKYCDPVFSTRTGTSKATH